MTTTPSFPRKRAASDSRMAVQSSGFVRLGDCCKFYSGGTPAKGTAQYWNGDIPWFSPKDIKTFDLCVAQDRISKLAIAESATQLIMPGTILVVGRSGVLAHTLPVGIVRQPSTFNQDIKAIVPSDAFDPEFVALYLRAKQPHVLADGVKRGPTVHSLVANFLEDLEIPTLQLPEQRHIAARLKAQLAEVDTARQAAQAQVREADLLRSRLLQAAFNDLGDTPRKALGEIADIQLGKMLSPKAKTGTAAFPYLRNQNVQWGRFDLRDLATMDFDERERTKFSLRRGDLLLCEGGEPGRCAVWEAQIPDCYYQKALHRIRPHDGIADSEFLSLWIRLQAQTGAFEDQNAKTTIAHLPLVRLEQLGVPAVPINDQRRIVTRLKVQLAEADAIAHAAAAQLAEIERLPQRLLAKAFAAPA